MMRSMSAREQILAAVETALGPRKRDAGAIAAEALALLDEGPPKLHDQSALQTALECSAYLCAT
jgi:hypothetical protein